MKRRDSRTARTENHLTQRDSRTSWTESPLKQRDARTSWTESPLKLRDARTPRTESPLKLRDARTPRTESPLQQKDARISRTESLLREGGAPVLPTGNPLYRLVDLFLVFTAVRTSTIPFLAPGTPPSSMRRCFSASTRASLMLRTDMVSLPYCPPIFRLGSVRPGVMLVPIDPP